MGLVGCVVAIVGLYGFAVPLGINTSVGHLQDQLGGHVQTEHFDIYYAPKRLDRRAVEALAADHEAAYRFLQRRLDLGDVDGPERIQSYLYPNPDVKARLTGARYTSVSPVWLQEPQVHLLVDRVEASLGHELAHVFSRPYGLPLLNASWLPGLVEGWAVALEPPDPYPSVHDLVRVATATEETQALSGKAGALVDRLTPWGFWTGRGAVSYATMGSFVRYLLDRYGPDRLKAVYATGSFESVYDRSLAGLAEEWADSLAARPMVARAAQDVVAQRFTQPSLFESECPHFVPIHQRHLQAARTARRRGDTSVVSRHLRRSLEVEPRYIPAHEVLARRRLAQGRISTVRRQLDTIAAERRTAEILLLQGDARARGGQPDSARRYYENARQQLPLYAHEARARLLLRRAVADRPDVVRVLTSGDPAREQARSLTASLTETMNVVQAWQALRFLDAHRYAAADSVWQEGASFRPDGPRAWRRAYGIQSRAWRAEAAYRAGRFSAAQRLAETASATAAAHGARAWSRMLQRWAQRARRSPL